MKKKPGWKNKWYWTGLGTIAVTIIADNISEYTKNIPILKYIVNFFKWIYAEIYGLLNFQVKIWVVLLGCLVLILLQKLLKFSGNKTSELPSFYGYTSDKFHNWIWKWKWQNYGRGWEIDNLTPYCNICDVELSLGGSIYSPSARCPSCHTLFGEYQQRQVEFAGDAEKLIRAKATKMGSVK